jgi:hypothetical protein
MAEEVCFSRQDFNTYMFLLLCVIIYIIYILYHHKENMANVDLNAHLSETELRKRLVELQDELYRIQLSEQRCQKELFESQKVLTQVSQSSQQQNLLLNKIYNPLVSPERYYPGGRLNLPAVNDYQMIGYIYHGNERFPLFGRYKFPGKTDKWEYYLIDESRNRLKIPFKSVNDNELYDGDTINVTSVGNGFQVKIYDYDQIRYNPNL